MDLKKIIKLCCLVCFCSCDSSNDIDITKNNPGTNDFVSAPCENGFADEYPCNGYDLVARISLESLGATAGNDIWGWTDSTTGIEYAIMGLNNGTAFISLEDPQNPLVLGYLNTATTNSIWRDIKVYKNHAFIVSEASGHGMQVFNLEKLRSVSNPPQNFVADELFTGFGNAHNIVINESSGFAYAVGTARGDIYNGGAHFIDVNDPVNPVAAGGLASEGYTHDAQVITYSGPDTRYTGKEIFIGSNETRIVIVDVSDKMNPQLISSLTYNNRQYTHQGWFSEDQRYFLLGDELDEIQFGFNSRTLIFDMSDLENPEFYDEYLGPTNAVDHNGYVKGNEFFLSNYTAGLRVLDISGLATKNVTETGYFDTYPQTDNAFMSGVWSVYPYFSSGSIIISDTESGFFIVKKSN